MPGPFEAAGVAHEPTEYAPLTMDRYITGLWTQRSQLRDAAVPYAYAKYFSASRFDALIDGINREITAKLTFKRRPGHSVWNASLFPPIRSFYSFKFTQDGKQTVRVMADTRHDVRDATPPTNAALFGKPPNSGPTRFLGVGTQLFMCDGVDQYKWTQSAKSWQPLTAYKGGDFIVDPNGNIQSVAQNVPATQSLQTIKVIAATSNPTRYALEVDFQTSPPMPQWVPGSAMTFAGVVNLPQLNSQTLIYDPGVQIQYGLPGGLNVVYFAYSGPAAGPFSESAAHANGTANNGGTSGSSTPAWSGVNGGHTTDGGVIWTCMGPAVQNLALAGPKAAPLYSTAAGMQYWAPFITAPSHFAVLDSNENLEVVTGTSAYDITGPQQPKWNEKFSGITQDGNLVYWTNCGNVGSWAPLTYTYLWSAILDPNGNLQLCTVGAPVGAPPSTPSSTGSTQPAFSTAFNGTTVDGDITWTCLGPGKTLVSGSLSYAYSWHCVDGSVTTASPAIVIPNGILGPAGGFSVTLQGLTPPDPQCDQIWIWRTDQGGSTLVFRTSIANPSPGTQGTWTWTDTDPTSAALNPLIIAPVNAVGANNPPPSTATAPEYHLQRVWMIDGSTVRWSGGPDTLTGNGNTAFPGNNAMQFPETLTRLMSSVTNSAALIIFGTANMYAILGTGTATDPFYPVSYMPTVGFLNYDAITRVASTIYGFSNNSKGVELDPGSGYVEYGFAIGDQFKVMSTAGLSTTIFDPASAFVTWHEKESGDSALYVADGQIGWFRYSPVASPESGFLWSPFAKIMGGTSCVQSVEVATGQFELLVGPFGDPEPFGVVGPILKRDTSVNTDNGVVYDQSYGTIGNVVLCESGEVAEVAHIALDAYRQGDRPQVGMLYGEIAETPDIGFDMLHWTSVDPPILEESETLYSDRYVTSQDGVCPKCRHVQIKIAWPSQDAPDELMAHAIFGAKYSERRQQPG